MEFVKGHLERVPQPYFGDLRSPWLLTTVSVRPSWDDPPSWEVRQLHLWAARTILTTSLSPGCVWAAALKGQFQHGGGFFFAEFKETSPWLENRQGVFGFFLLNIKHIKPSRNIQLPKTNSKSPWKKWWFGRTILASETARPPLFGCKMLSFREEIVDLLFNPGCNRGK